MRNIFILLVCSLLTSCITQQRCLDRFPPKTDSVVVIHDSIRLVHDTTYVPYEEITISDLIPCPDVVYDKSVTKKGLTSSVSIKKGIVTVSCKSDSLQLIIDRYERERTIERSVTKQPKTIIEYKTKWYDTALRWLFIVLILVLLGDLGLSYLRLRK